MPWYQLFLESDGEPWSVPSQSDCPIHPWASADPAQSPETARRPLLESRHMGAPPAHPASTPPSHTHSASRFAEYFENIHSSVPGFSGEPWHILCPSGKSPPHTLCPTLGVLCPGRPPQLPPRAEVTPSFSVTSLGTLLGAYKSVSCPPPSSPTPRALCTDSDRLCEGTTVPVCTP